MARPLNDLIHEVQHALIELYYQVEALKKYAAKDEKRDARLRKKAGFKSKRKTK